MKFKEYQDQLFMSTTEDDKRMVLARIALGMCGEAGEVAEKVKKYLRGDGLLDQDAMLLELGDVLWHIGMLANSLDINLDDVASRNLEKIESRIKRGVVKGSGDYR